MARKKSTGGRYERTSVPGIYRRNNAYVVKVYNPAKNQGKGGHDEYRADTFDEAREIKRDKESIRRTRARTGVLYTVSEWFGEHWQHGPDGVTHDSRWLELFPRRKDSTMLHNLERSAAFVREHRDVQLIHVTPEMARDFHNANPGRTTVLRAAFNDAIKNKQLDENPFAEIDIQKSRGRRDITVLTDVEVLKLMAMAERVLGDFGREVFAPMIAVAAGTGCRPGENFALTKDDLDLDAGEVHVWRQFNGRTRKFTTLKGTRLDRHVAMLQVAQRALERAELPDDGPLWRSIRDVPIKFRELYFYWPRVRDAFVMSLPESHHLQRRHRKETPGGNLDFYELRHHFGTALARVGCSEREIMDQMGHEDAETARVYVHLTNDDVRRSVRDKLRRAA